MNRTLNVCAIIALSALLTACSDDSSDDSSAAATDATSTDVAAGDTTTTDTAVQGLDGTWHFVISDWMSTLPMVDVALCASVAGTECELTDDEGMATMTGTVMPGEMVQLRGDKDGYFPFLVESVVPDELTAFDEPTPYVMADDNIVGQLSGSLGAEIDDAKGHVSMFVNMVDEDGELVPMLGATVTMDSAVEAGPNYMNAIEDFGNGIFTTEPGVTAGGIVQFFNVDPGLATITIVGDYTCVTGTSGAQADDRSVGITVEASRVSYTSLTCAAE